MAANSYVADEERVAVERDEFINAFGLTADGHTLQVLRDNNIRKLSQTSYSYGIIREYFQNSLPQDVDIRIVGIYSAHNVSQYMRFNYQNYDVVDSMMLWHGTHRQNLIGILENGLTPTRPKALYGPAIYFADRLALSSYYTDMNGNEVFLLCRVALGHPLIERTPLPLESPAEPIDSIVSIGHQIPDPTKQTTFNDHFLVPCGPTVLNPSQHVLHYSPWRYNDYAIFERDRVQIKFVVHCRRQPRVYHEYPRASPKVIVHRSRRPGPSR